MSAPPLGETEPRIVTARSAFCVFDDDDARARTTRTDIEWKKRLTHGACRIGARCAERGIVLNPNDPGMARAFR